MELREKVIKGLECCLPMTTRDGCGDCGHCPYDRKITLEGGITECCHELMGDALALLKAQEPPTSELISSAIECLLHPQDADDSDMAKAIDTAVRTMRLLKAQEPMLVEERADTDTINCPRCGQQFARVGHDKSIYLDTDEEPNYCPKCGQAVKWDGN